MQVNPDQENNVVAGGIGSRAVRATLEHHLTLQYNLCCALENVADKLPDALKHDEVVSLARSIVPIVRRSHAFEESVLFPLLREKAGKTAMLEETLDRLHGEHWEDESYAEEIQASLFDLARGELKSGVETLGYMLRGFFEGLRRHIAFEREHLVPLLVALDE